MPNNLFHLDTALLNNAHQRLNQSPTLIEFVLSILQNDSIPETQKLLILRTLGITRHLHHTPYLKTLRPSHFEDAFSAYEMEQSYLLSHSTANEFDRFEARNALAILLAGLGKKAEFMQTMDSFLEEAIQDVRRNGTHMLDWNAPFNPSEFYFDKVCENLQAACFADKAEEYRQKWQSFIAEQAALTANEKEAAR